MLKVFIRPIEGNVWAVCPKKNIGVLAANAKEAIKALKEAGLQEFEIVHLHENHAHRAERAAA